MRRYDTWVVAVGKRIYRKQLTKSQAEEIIRDLKKAVQNVAAYRMVEL